MTPSPRRGRLWFVPHWLPLEGKLSSVCETDEVYLRPAALLPLIRVRSAHPPVSLRLGHAAAETVLLRYPKNAAGLRLSLRFSTAAPPAPRSSRHRRRSAWAPPACHSLPRRRFATPVGGKAFFGPPRASAPTGIISAHSRGARRAGRLRPAADCGRTRFGASRKCAGTTLPGPLRSAPPLTQGRPWGLSKGFPLRGEAVSRRLTDEGHLHLIPELLPLIRVRSAHPPSPRWGKALGGALPGSAFYS